MWYCAICDILVRGPSQAQSHITGKKHKKNTKKQTSPAPEKVPVPPEAVRLTLHLLSGAVFGSIHVPAKAPWGLIAAHVALHNKNLRPMPPFDARTLSAADLHGVVQVVYDPFRGWKHT